LLSTYHVNNDIPLGLINTLVMTYMKLSYFSSH